MFGRSRQVERVLALGGGQAQLGAHHFRAGVVRQLQVVHARHHRRQVLIRIQGRLQRLAHHRQRWVQRLETC